MRLLFVLLKTISLVRNNIEVKFRELLLHCQKYLMVFCIDRTHNQLHIYDSFSNRQMH